MNLADLNKIDSDHLTAKYQETSMQIDELQNQLMMQREKSSSLEHAIIGKQHLMKLLIEEIIKRHLTSNNSFI